MAAGCTASVLEAAADGVDRHIALHHNDSGSLSELLSVGTAGPGADVRPLWPSVWKTVHLAQQNAVPGGHGIRWEW